MQNMLKQENVQILEQVDSWQDAIRIAVEPLITGGYVEPRYVDGVFENTLNYGPYYVLTPDLALIHARSEQGVLHRQLAVTLLRQPIRFSPDGYNVRLLVAFAEEDPVSHNESLQYLASMFSDTAKMKGILEAQSPQELYHYFVDRVTLL